MDMKTFGKILLGLLGLAVIGAGAMYLIVIRPGQQFVEANKDLLLETVANFEKCLVEQPGQVCRDTLMTEDAKKTASAEGLSLLGAKIKTNLGKRLTVVPDEKSFTWNKYAGTAGFNFTISFNLKTAYEKDPNASETISIVSHNNEPFLISGYRINSNQMLK
jgi:hypothetical protein